MKRTLFLMPLAICAWGQANFPDVVYTPLAAKDNIQTSLTATMSASDNVAVVQSGAGWTPQMVAYICDSTTGTPARCTSYEVMLVTAVAGNVLTVTRGYGGSTAKTHAAGKLVQNAYTAVYTNSAQNELQAIEKFGGSGRYVDLRYYGAVCDGTTNVQPAVTAAIAAGYKHLFLPANCIWIPTGNRIPAGVRVLGENWDTSKIWAADPINQYVIASGNTKWENVNIGGKGCTNQSVGVGCPVWMAANTNTTQDISIQNFPRNLLYADVGSTESTTMSNDTNGIVVIQHGQGGGIYGQYIGGVGASSGTAIHAEQAADCTSCAGLRSSKSNKGPGFIIDEGPQGGTGSDIQYTSQYKTTGDIFNMFHTQSTFNGNMISANLGVSGAFNGNFFDLSKNTVRMFGLDNSGNLGVNGSISTGPHNYISVETGANNAIAGTTGAVGMTIAAGDGFTVTVKLAHTLQVGANTFNYNGTGAFPIKSSRNPANNIATGYAVGGVITLKNNGASVWLDVSQ